jgi:hypothetical protein
MTYPIFYHWLGADAEQFHEALLIPVDTWQVDLTDPCCDE